MAKPTYKELEKRVKELEKTVLKPKLADKALIESEKLFRLIVENVTDVIWIVDMEMKFTYFSPSVTQMRGYSVQEAMAQPIGESMTPATFESAIKMIAEELELHNKGERDFKRSKKIEAELTCKDGSTVWTEIEANFIYNSEGQPTAILGITRNITEKKESEKARKLAEQVLQESEEKFRNLFHNHSAVKIIIDPGTGNIVEANRSAERFYGWSVEQLKEMRIQDISMLSDEQVKAEMEKARLLERNYFEFRHRLADGSFREVAVFSCKINIKGKALLHSIIHDITERKRTEEQKDRLVSNLQKTLSEVKTLQGFLPICSHCKKIRDDKGYWNQIESYINKHSDTEFSHGICPECANKYYPDMDLYDDNGEITED